MPDGIDPGFGHNIGEAAWGRGQQSIAMERHGQFTALDTPGQRAPRLPRLSLDIAKAALAPSA